jgi:hypothetical protein
MISKILLFFFLLSSVEARLFFQVSIENKKGIDLGLILTSELHSMEEVIIGRPLLLRMKNGVAIEMKAYWSEPKEGMGPSEQISIEGKIIDKKDNILKDFSKDPLVAHLGKETKISHEKEDQRIEIKIIPKLK